MPGPVIVEADGGARGNPGPAGYGAVVRDAVTGDVLAERSGGLGSTTNNVAEYSGLIAGLGAAVELGAADVEVRMDSKLVIEQMTGNWRVRQPHLQPLASEAAALVRRLGRVSWRWVPRTQNRHADRLANEAMDAQAAASQPRPPGVPMPGPRAASQPRPPAAPTPWLTAAGPPTRLLLLRHGETELTAAARFSGRGDVPLTPLGEQQAHAAAHRLAKEYGAGDVAAVITSPLRRCTRTGEVVAAALATRVVVHDGLIEADFGGWEGLTMAEAAARDPELHARWRTGDSVAPPGGESFDTVRRRVRKARDGMIAEYDGATLVLVTHVTPIKLLLMMALDVGVSLLFRLHLDSGSLSVAEFYPDGAGCVRLVNDTSHLP
jgi:broad specificity phosphatase PhoE/ribonuclease HI